MSYDRIISRHTERTVLVLILMLFAGISVVGITWGLPSRQIDRYLFGDDPPWSGEKIYRLAGAAEKFSPDRGADVDADPLARPDDEPAALTDTDEDIAKIYLRYRLYTYQPDEMITMMALAGMNPRKLDLDPRLYQYGGLFIYPVGALVGACGLVGLIDVRSDVVYYLDNPDEFGKFYIVARAYSAAWGLVGVVIVFAIGRRLSGPRAGLFAALLFMLMPVVVCMAHEGKPHLPGAVLMLAAVLFAMRYLSKRAADFSPRGDAGTGTGERTLPMQNVTEPRANKFARATGSDWWLMCICCGAALGMVLSSWPIFVLIPLVAWRAAGFNLRGVANTRQTGAFTFIVKWTVGGVIVGTLVYLVTNPYIVINAFVNREVLRSNFGNSLAMYEIARIGEGFIRVLELTVEGATLPILVLGVIALIIVLVRGNAAIIPLAVPAAVFFIQFVLIGAGKPAEYGRFGIFTNTALAIGTACLFTHRRTRLDGIMNWTAAALVVIWVGLLGMLYLRSFYVDEAGRGSRMQLAAYIDRLSYSDPVIGVAAEPAPYSCPPLNFSRTDLLYFRGRWQFEQYASASWSMFIESVDRRVQGWDDSARMLGGPKATARRPANVTDRVHSFVHTYWPRERYGRVAGWQALKQRMSIKETQISWANKPFAVTSVMSKTWNNDDKRANHEDHAVRPQQ